jgi:hypothetical protein
MYLEIIVVVEEGTKMIEFGPNRIVVVLSSKIISGILRSFT